MAGEASVAHCGLRVLETEMSTAHIGHRAVRWPVIIVIVIAVTMFVVLSS